MGTRSPSGAMQMFWNSIVVMVEEHCECAECHWIVHFKIVKKINVMLCVFYHSTNKERIVIKSKFPFLQVHFLKQLWSLFSVLLDICILYVCMCMCFYYYTSAYIIYGIYMHIYMENIYFLSFGGTQMVTPFCNLFFPLKWFGWF